MSSSVANEEDFPGDTRRRMLKSGLLLALGASLPGAGSMATGARQAGQVGSLTKGMLAFTLSHEQFAAPELVPLGVAAEKAGFDLVATSDHFQPWQANERHSGLAWVTLGILGQQTQRIWMGTAVTCPTLRYHPAVVAEAFATLSLFHPGRIFLGLGSGEALNEQAATGQWPNWRERWDRLIEATTIIRQLWAGNAVQYKGAHYMVDAKLYDPPPHPIPILLAANGPKAIKLSAEHGDGLITDPMTWKQHKTSWESSAQSAGKDPSTMPVAVETFVVVGDDREAQYAAKQWNFIPKAFKGYHNIPDPAVIERRAAAELPLPKVYGDWTVSADPEVHVKAIRKLFDSGVTIVNIHSGQADQRKVIEFYGNQVLPRLRDGQGSRMSSGALNLKSKHRQFGAGSRQVSAIGQGTWNIEQVPTDTAVDVLRGGIDAGLTHIDTAEMYGSGKAEQVIAKAIEGRRHDVFLVSKVLPANASSRGVAKACEASLARLKTDHLDCYLLHWRGSHPLEDTVQAFDQLMRQGKILSWGVSNFDVDDLEEVYVLSKSQPPACNQVLYHLEERAIEHAVMPWCSAHGLAVVAYSPFGSQSGFPAPRSSGGKVLQAIADIHGATPRQVALQFLLRNPSVS